MGTVFLSGGYRSFTSVPGKTITPSTVDQIAVPSGFVASGDIIVAGDPELIPSNIVNGKSIFGVAGSYSGAEPVYEIVPPENIEATFTSALSRITLTLANNVHAVYGIGIAFSVGSSNMAAFLYPGNAYGEKNEAAAYRTIGPNLAVYTVSGSGNELYIYRMNRDSNLYGLSLDFQFGATVYYVPA